MTLAILVCKQGRQVYRLYMRKGGLLKIATAQEVWGRSSSRVHGRRPGDGLGDDRSYSWWSFA